MKNEIKKTMHKTPLHYSYRPESYSEQARKLCNRAITNVNSGVWCMEQAFRSFCLSWRCPLIRFRALNKFNRYVKAGKVHENFLSVEKWNEYKKERNLVELEWMSGKFLEY